MEKIDIVEILKKDKTIQIKPQGYSMYPLLIPGRDEVILQKAVSSKLKRGDVVLFRREGSILVLHRIWKKKGNQFFFVGDNQIEIEGPIAEGQIYGVMTAFIRNGIYISVKNPIYCFYAKIWLLLRPFRKYISVFFRNLIKIFPK